MMQPQPSMQARPSSVKLWWMAARPKTLAAAVAPVIVGTAMAIEAGRVEWLAAVCALLGALFIQIGTNFSNDYVDFQKGADTGDRKGPLRVTQAGWVTPQGMKQATILVFGLAVAAGSYLIWRGGWPILVVGLFSIACGVLYTVGRYSLAYLGLADLFVLLFFGPVAVGGTYYVQALALPTEVLIAGLGPGLLATAILLVNNIRDVEEDRAANKKTLVVRAGRSFGVGLYVFCILGAVLLPGILFFLTGHHLASLTASLVVLPAIPIVQTLCREDNARALNPLLGATGRLLVIYSLAFSLGWMV